MIRDLFKVETLDVRFASPTGQPHPTAQPSKWNTAEYYLYYVVFLTIPFLMFKSVYDVSQPDHPGYRNYEALLEPGWIPGRKVDNSDAQYRGFRENIPYMTILLLLHPVLRRVYERIRSGGAAPKSNGRVPNEVAASRTSDARLNARTSFDLGFAIILLIALHGVSTIKILLILYTNYKIATVLPKQYAGTVTWVFNIGILFANELGSGYRFADVARILQPSTAEKQLSENWGTWLDSYGGLLPRWEILFNITVLRLIAFNFDYLWMLDRRASSPVEVSLQLQNSKHASGIVD
jgi:hypothetical protein